MRVPVILDTHIRLHERTLTPIIVDELKEALSVPNKAKEQARKEKLPDWQELPDSIVMWDYDDSGRLIFPRGFRRKLINGLSNSEFELVWKDHRTSIPFDEEFASDLTPIELRDHQAPAVEAILEHENGIYEAPPGSGKTVTILEAIRLAGQRAIILVDKSELAEQWAHRAKHFLGVEVGRIGEGVFDPGEITVATKQTLWRRRKELQHFGFFEDWGFVAYDECHHITADTYQFVVQQFPSKYLIGVSATPVRIPWTWPIARNLLGPIIQRTTNEELQDEGFLMKPNIKIIETDFTFDFRSTYINKGGYRISSNYPQLIKDLISDTQRNDRIVSEIMKRTDKRILVTSLRHKHFDHIHSQLEKQGYPNPVYRLTGKESRDQRRKVMAGIDAEPSLIFSTIADEGLDIPTLDTLVIAYPTRNLSVMRQKIGRVERGAPGKATPEVIDVYDSRIGVLKNQFRERMYGIYRSENMDIEYV